MYTRCTPEKINIVHKKKSNGERKEDKWLVTVDENAVPKLVGGSINPPEVLSSSSGHIWY